MQCYQKIATDLDVNCTISISIIINDIASLGTNNLFDVISDPTRKLVDDVTISYRLFSYLGFPRLVYETLCRWKSKCKCKLTRLLVWNSHILLFCYEINLFLFIFMKVNFIF